MKKMEKQKSLNMIKDLIQSLKVTIRTEYKAEVVGIFGSFVRGEEKESSDIDILVKFNDDADLFDFIGLSIFLEEKLGRSVDVVPYDTLRTELKERIMKETITV